MPEKVVEQIMEHSSCFCLFYFDADGSPCFYQNAPQIKDSMAMHHFIQDYLSGQLGGDVPFNDEGPEDFQGNDEND